MKILVTGAHFTPAVAVIEELKKNKDIKIVYVGRKNTLEGDKTPSRESNILPNLKVKFIPLIAGRLQKSFTIYTVSAFLKIPLGFIQSLYIILSERPDVILSFGGYIALPIVIIGWLFSIPIIIHEQTLVFGLANKISTLFADKIAVSFNQNQPLNKKTYLNGNPLRQEILHPLKKMSNEFIQLFNFSKKNNLPVILIMGGNQGSHTINKVVEEIWTKLTKISCLIHVTGDNKFGDFERLKKLENEKYLVKKWLAEEIGSILSKVNLVICRAGANTLTELSFFGKQALVIPLEPTSQNEQVKNAKFFQDRGLVKILPQSQLSGQSLMKSVKSMLNNLSALNKGAKNVKGIIIPDAAKRLALETLILGNV